MFQIVALVFLLAGGDPKVVQNKQTFASQQQCEDFLQTAPFQLQGQSLMAMLTARGVKFDHIDFSCRKVEDEKVDDGSI